MSVSTAELNQAVQGVGRLEVCLLANVATGGSSGGSGDQCAGCVVQPVMRVGEPPGVMECRGDQLRRRFEFDAGTRVVNVPPTDLVCEPVLVMTRRVELVECFATAVRGIRIA